MEWVALFLRLHPYPPPPSHALELYTYAASTVGFGGFFRGKWFQERWPPHLQLSKEQGISIEWQELFPIVVAYAIWYPHFLV